MYSADSCNRVVGAAIKLVLGSEDSAFLLQGGWLPLPALLFLLEVNFAPFQFKPTLEPECPEPPELFRFRSTQTHT